MSGTQILVGTYTEALPYLVGRSDGIIDAHPGSGGALEARLLVAARSHSLRLRTGDGFTPPSK